MGNGLSQCQCGWVCGGNILNRGVINIARLSADINQFDVTGRGGLPPRPEEPLNGNAVWSDTRMPKVTPQQPSLETPPNQPASQSNSTSIIPATGWVFNNQGEVTLISHASYTTDLESTPANCSRKQS